MTGEPSWAETIELEGQDFVALEFERVWPKYRVSWSVRRPTGDSDFPLADGFVERMPPRDGDLAAMWEEMRVEAVARASETQQTTAPEEASGSLLARLFGKKRH